MIVRGVTFVDRWDAVDGRAVVMAGHEVSVLSRLAVALIDLLGDAERTDEDLGEALVQTVGSAPEDLDVIAWVRATCEDLASRGLVLIVSAQ